MRRNTFFWLVKRWNPRTKERAREGSPENGAQPDDPPKFIALADEAMSEKATSVVGTFRT